MLDGQTFEVDEGIDLLEPHEGMIEDILTNDPLELAVIRDEVEQNVENIDDDGYTKMLDSAKSMERMVACLSLVEANDNNQNNPTGTASPVNSTDPSRQLDDPWSELKAPKVELKSLPKGSGMHSWARIPHILSL